MVRERTRTRLHGASTCCLAIPRAHVRMRAHLRMHACLACRIKSIGSTPPPPAHTFLTGPTGSDTWKFARSHEPAWKSSTADSYSPPPTDSYSGRSPHNIRRRSTSARHRMRPHERPARSRCLKRPRACRPNLLDGSPSPSLATPSSPSSLHAAGLAAASAEPPIEDLDLDELVRRRARPHSHSNTPPRPAYTRPGPCQPRSLCHVAAGVRARQHVDSGPRRVMKGPSSKFVDVVQSKWNVLYTP